MRNLITYEWVMEEIENIEGDIIDPHFCETLMDALSIEPGSQAIRVEYALVRNEGSIDDGLTYREYAYIEGGELPASFDSGYKIPARYHEELLNNKPR